MTTDERKEIARRRWHGCRQCGGMYTMQEKDGKDVGGLPGITYRQCGNCGYTVAKTKKMPKRFF